MMTFTTKTAGVVRVLVLGAAGLGLAGCSEFPSLNRLTDPAKAGAGEDTVSETKLVERDIEAPEVFDVTEAGLWDGRPSLGGVWVAHPDVEEPEWVIIRNTANGKFVIGALFRRERDIPGPRLQASSDAAAALGMLAGAPVDLNVTALRREEGPADPATAAEPELNAAADVEEAALAPVAGAQAAIDASEDTPTIAPQSQTPETVIKTAAAAPATTTSSTSKLAKPYIQIGIFSVEANANRAADMMRTDGMVPTVYKQEANGKTFWRVVIGPSNTRSEQTALLKQIKNTGFTDAYAVTK